jgi:hypothetical protein
MGLSWQMNLFVFVDGSFANNKDLSSQIGYEIILAQSSVCYSYCCVCNNKGNAKLSPGSVC